MPKGSNGDLIIVNDPKRNLFDIPMTIIADQLHDEYAAYYDSDIVIAEDFNSNTYVLKEDEYRLKYDDVEEFNKILDNVAKTPKKYKTINISDVIKLKQNTKGLQKILYYVIETHDNGVTIFDDSGEHKVSLPHGHYETVDTNNLFECVISLQNQIHDLRQLIVRTNTLVADDIKKELDNFTE